VAAPVLAAQAAGGCLAAAVGQAPILVGHRGYPLIAPENTLASFRAAIAEGAKWVETDVQVTRDGYLVLMHDQALSRTTNAPVLYPDRSPWLVSSFDLAEIRRLDAGFWMAEKYVGEPVPTLEELLALLQQENAGLFLEIKSQGESDPDRIALPLTAQGWVQSGIPTQPLCVMSFSEASAKRFKSLVPAVDVQVLFGGPPSAASLKNVDSFADGIVVSFDTLTDPVYSGPERILKNISAYTIDSKADLADALKHPLKAVITNNFPLLRVELANIYKDVTP